MSTMDTQLPDTSSPLQVAENSLSSASDQIQYFTGAIRDLGSRVRSIADETFDLLLSYTSKNDIERRKREVVNQYSTVLNEFASDLNKPLSQLNRAWMTVDQSLGFYFVATGPDSSVDLSELLDLIDAMNSARRPIPDAIGETSNLITAIRSSAGGLEGLDAAIERATNILEKVSGELDLADAVIQRQIILAERLYELLSEV